MGKLTVNQKVVVWAQGKLGKKVGRGECWDLAERALEQARAQTSNDLGPVGDDTDYIWGEPKELKDIEPGDILQLRDHIVKITIVTRLDFPDGSWTEDTKDSTATRTHHTAIVNGMLNSVGAVATLEQHVKPLGDVVQEKKIYTRDVPSKSVKSVERRKNPSSKKSETTKVTKTVTVMVTGKIWAYRPKPKSK